MAKEKIREFIIEMNRNGTTFILTTHDLVDVERLTRRLIVVNSGEIVFDDTMDALRGFSGSKKNIIITSQKDLPDFTAMHGITVKSVISSCNAELELDTDILDINRFIQAINADCILNDLTISEPPIESVIKELYIKNRGSC